MRFIIRLAVLLVTIRAHAGPIEVGGSANYRASNYDRNNYIRSTSYTATASYYFWSACALEFNYTNGYSVQKSKGPSITDAVTKIEDLSVFTSADVVFSFAEPEDALRPYAKIGGGYLTKDRYRRVDLKAKERLSKQEGLVPSAGLGLAIGVSRNLNLKIGVDAWTTPSGKNTPSVIDYAGRAGASWIF